MSTAATAANSTARGHVARGNSKICRITPETATACEIDDETARMGPISASISVGAVVR